jgi:hypothetical protein
VSRFPWRRGAHVRLLGGVLLTLVFVAVPALAVQAQSGGVLGITWSLLAAEVTRRRAPAIYSV